MVFKDKGSDDVPLLQSFDSLVKVASSDWVNWDRFPKSGIIDSGVSDLQNVTATKKKTDDTQCISLPLMQLS